MQFLCNLSWTGQKSYGEVLKGELQKIKDDNKCISGYFLWLQGTVRITTSFFLR